MSAYPNLRRRAIIPLPVDDDRGGPDAPYDPNRINPADVQGDIYVGFPKQTERFIFFSITNVPQFKAALRVFKPTSAKDVAEILGEINAEKGDAANEGRPVEPIETPLVQISFTRFGLNTLNVQEKILDDRFDSYPMRHDKVELGDKERWEPVFDEPGNSSLHGVFNIASGTGESCRKAESAVIGMFQLATTVLHSEVGYMLPNRIEHFGYRDGISQPALRDVTVANPGQMAVDPGVIVMGFKGDPKIGQRPTWTKGGSLLVFRKLEQDVEGFRNYVMARGQNLTPDQLGPSLIAWPPEAKAELFGARLVGRWKSGAPVVLTPFGDDPQLAADPRRNNDFNYMLPNGIAGLAPAERACPFFAHIRKVAPRNPDPAGSVSQERLEASSIIRTGIPYGPMWTTETADEKRGLLFVCYQSVLDNGFVNITVNWANDPTFPPTSAENPTKYIAQDPIVGGPDPKWPADNGPEPEYFVTSRGGEYFFVPPISALKLWAA